MQFGVLKRKESEARKRSLVKTNLKGREKNFDEMWNSKEENGGEERRIAGGRVKAEFDYLVISGKFGNYLQNGIDSIEGGGVNTLR